MNRAGRTLEFIRELRQHLQSTRGDIVVVASSVHSAERIAKALDPHERERVHWSIIHNGEPFDPYGYTTGSGVV